MRQRKPIEYDLVRKEFRFRVGGPGRAILIADTLEAMSRALYQFRLTASHDGRVIFVNTKGKSHVDPLSA